MPDVTWGTATDSLIEAQKQRAGLANALMRLLGTASAEATTAVLRAPVDLARLDAASSPGRAPPLVAGAALQRGAEGGKGPAEAKPKKETAAEKRKAAAEKAAAAAAEVDSVAAEAQTRAAAVAAAAAKVAAATAAAKAARGGEEEDAAADLWDDWKVPNVATHPLPTPPILCPNPRTIRVPNFKLTITRHTAPGGGR